MIVLSFVRTPLELLCVHHQMSRKQRCNNPNFLQQLCNSISILSSVLSCVKEVKPSTKPYLRTLKRLGKKVTKSNTNSKLGSWTCCVLSYVVQKKDFAVLVVFNSITDCSSCQHEGLSNQSIM